MGTKKGEKVDYAILRNGKPILLFECKRYGAELGDSAKSQLHRYFSVTGVTRRRPNRWSHVPVSSPMSTRRTGWMTAPFYEFDLRSADEADAKEISRFTRSSFDADALQGQAQDLKYTREVLSLIEQEWKRPIARLRQALLQEGLSADPYEEGGQSVHWNHQNEP